MAKSFACRRTHEGVGVTEDTIEHVHRSLRNAENQHGQGCRESLQTCLLLGAMYSGVEDYEKAEPLLKRCVEDAFKEKPALNTNEITWSGSLLAESYFELGRIPEGLQVTAELKTVSKGMDMSAEDPLLEGFIALALSLKAQGDFENRVRGFVAALMTLCLYVSRGFHRSDACAHVWDQLQVLFKSYGIGGEEWEWSVKHARLTRYDFVGLLSILLHQTGLAPAPLHTVVRRRPRVIEVR